MSNQPVEPGSVVHVMRFFQIPIATFKKEWEALSEKAKSDIKSGLKDGTLTYA